MTNDVCRNQNHSKMNVGVRNCVACGEVVNKNIPTKNCGEAQHAKKRKEQSLFCSDCGKSLRSSN